MQTTEENNQNKPLFSTRKNGLSIAIFESQFRDKSGAKSYRLVIQNSWKDKQTNEWVRQNISSFTNKITAIEEMLELTKEFCRTNGLPTYQDIPPHVQIQPKTEQTELNPNTLPPTESTETKKPKQQDKNIPDNLGDFID